MYLQKNDLDIEDFLQAVEFVVPEHYNLEYFVVPRGEGFTPPPGAAQAQNTYEDDQSIAYKMTPPQLKQDYAAPPPEYSIWEPGDLNRRQPQPAILPRVTDPSELQSPFVKIQESADDRKLEFILTESVFPFPKGTMFSCTRKAIREETEWWKENKEKVLNKDEEKKDD
jgi:hypothetical protein